MKFLDPIFQKKSAFRPMFTGIFVQPKNSVLTKNASSLYNMGRQTGNTRKGVIMISKSGRKRSCAQKLMMGMALLHLEQHPDWKPQAAAASIFRLLRNWDIEGKYAGIKVFQQSFCRFLDKKKGDGKTAKKGEM